MLGLKSQVVWLGIVNNKRYILGSVYVKLDQGNAIEDLIKMLNKAYNSMNKFKAIGIIVTGDFNARHVSWGDSKNNEYGKKLLEKWKMFDKETLQLILLSGASATLMSCPFLVSVWNAGLMQSSALLCYWP